MASFLCELPFNGSLKNKQLIINALHNNELKANSRQNLTKAVNMNFKKSSVNAYKNTQEGSPPMLINAMIN